MAFPGKSHRQGSALRMDNMMKKNAHIGSSLEDFLKEEGILEETRAIPLKETLTWQVEKSIKQIKSNSLSRVHENFTLPLWQARISFAVWPVN
jgi:hypothetical protein